MGKEKENEVSFLLITYTNRDECFNNNYTLSNYYMYIIQCVIVNKTCAANCFGLMGLLSMVRVKHDCILSNAKSRPVIRTVGRTDVC